MFKYAKVIKDNGECMVFLGSDIEWAKSQGYTELEVRQSDIDFNWYLVEKCPMKSEEEKDFEEKERIAKLSLTKREVFLGLYEAKGVTPEQIKAQITDPAALIEFEYANDYFRGNPLIDTVGAALGITPTQLDCFFKTKDPNCLKDEV